jgi:hemolysin activation/secretion protein
MYLMVARCLTKLALLTCYLFFGVIGSLSYAASGVIEPSPDKASVTPAALPNNPGDAGDQAITPIIQGDASEIQPPVQEEKFDLLELRVKGNHLLEDTEIERTVYPFLGPEKTVSTVENARNTLEQIYRNKGYQTVSVDVPEQDVVNGVIVLQVVEGKVARLRVTDSRYFSLGKIKSAIPEVAEGNVPNFPLMQKQLQEFGEKSSDRSVTPILRAGDIQGTMEVDLKVKDELPLHGRIELNGRNTASTSKLRLVNSIHYDNLWQMMHSASLMYQVSPENSDEVEVWAGTYALPLPSSDAKLALYAVSSSSNASIASGTASSIVGIGQIYGIRLIKPLPGLDSYSHSLTLGADYKDFKEDITFISQDTSLTPISYLPFLVQYSGSIFEKTWQASMTLGLNFHFRGVGGDSNSLKRDRNGNLVDNENKIITDSTQGVVVGEFENKRFGSRPNYTYLTLDASFNHDLPYDMQFVSRFSAQLSDSPLISNEQFSLGGMDSVRGYFETQALADDGIAASVELRSPHLAPTSMDYINKLQALVFADGGYGHVQQASRQGSPDSYSLASMGFGLRFQVWKYFEGVLDLGIPLINLDDVKAGHPKFHFSVAAEF